tara:strand:+ start:561 stop:1271 length:711 start_codon:yes stop_codon:yes gene_type:complete
MTLKKYIKNKKQNNFSINGIEVSIYDIQESPIDFKQAVTKGLALVPEHLLGSIKYIVINKTEQMKQRDIQAYYKDNTAFITNDQDNEADFIDDLIHEIAHSVEEMIGGRIYQDGKIEREFLAKRKILFDMLYKKDKTLKLKDFLKTKYTKDFDEYLYLKVGYKKLGQLTSSIFYSPYAVTSLREYFANAFEAVFYKNHVSRVKNISPELFKKIEEITYENKKDNISKFTKSRDYSS